MNIHKEFAAFLKKRKLTLTNEQQVVATLFLHANSDNPIWLRARRSGVTTLFNALEDFYKYHQPEHPSDKLIESLFQKRPRKKA